MIGSGKILTPLDVKHLRDYDYKGFRYVDGVYEVNRTTQLVQLVKLRKATFSDKVKLLPAIGAAILARIVRKIKGKKGTELEKDLMRFYYQEEVKVRGYVE